MTAAGNEGRPAMTAAFVVYCSVAMSWLFQDEATPLRSLFAHAFVVLSFLWEDA